MDTAASRQAAVAWCSGQKRHVAHSWATKPCAAAQDSSASRFPKLCAAAQATRSTHVALWPLSTHAAPQGLGPAGRRAAAACASGCGGGVAAGHVRMRFGGRVVVVVVATVVVVLELLDVELLDVLVGDRVVLATQPCPVLRQHHACLTWDQCVVQFRSPASQSNGGCDLRRLVGAGAGGACVSVAVETVPATEGVPVVERPCSVGPLLLTGRRRASASALAAHDCGGPSPPAPAAPAAAPGLLSAAAVRNSAPAQPLRK